MRANILRIEIYNANISKFGILQICDIRYERRNLENAVNVRARTEQAEFFTKEEFAFLREQKQPLPHIG